MSTEAEKFKNMEKVLAVKDATLKLALVSRGISDKVDRIGQQYVAPPPAQNI